jgi:hypothetical protein
MNSTKPLAVIAPRLTPRELAVSACIGRRLTTKRIAAELDISESRVYALLAAVALKVGVPEGEDDRQCVGDWWRQRVGQEDTASPVVGFLLVDRPPHCLHHSGNQ